jgi:hypothetical protein
MQGAPGIAGNLHAGDGGLLPCANQRLKSVGVARFEGHRHPKGFVARPAAERRMRPGSVGLAAAAALRELPGDAEEGIPVRKLRDGEADVDQHMIAVE